MNPFEHYKTLLASACGIASRYLPDASQRIEQLVEQIDERKVHVMLFGAYNAGKSTLINALLGEERAVVGDIPTTDAVHRYDWDGHVLLDTPGINAPIAHEEVSTEQLKRANLILFVLRQEDQDAQNIIERIFTLIAQRRPLFVVLNYEDSDPAAIERIQSSFSLTLLNHARKNAIDERLVQQLPVILMNIRTASRGRLEGKAKLLEHSGFEAFIVRFKQWLQHFDSEQQLLKQTFGIIERALLAPVANCIDGETPHAQQLGAIDAQLEHMARQQQQLKNSARHLVLREILAARPAIEAALDQCTDPASLTRALEVQAQGIAEKLQQWLEGELQSMRKAQINELLSGAGIDPKLYSNIEESELLDKLSGPIFAQLKGINQDHLTSLLVLGRKLKIPMLKGRWLSTLQKWAGRAAPVVQLVFAIAEIFMAARSEEKENERNHSRALQRIQWIEETSAEVESALVQSVCELIDQLFREQRTPYEESRTALQGAASQREKDCSDWRELTRTLQALEFPA
jgi:GTPase SAR1 family protein